MTHSNNPPAELIKAGSREARAIEARRLEESGHPSHSRVPYHPTYFSAAKPLRQDGRPRWGGLKKLPGNRHRQGSF